MGHASGQDLDRRTLLIITGLAQSPLKLIERLDTTAQSNHNRIMGKKHLIIDPRQIYWQLWLESETAAEPKKQKSVQKATL